MNKKVIHSVFEDCASKNQTKIAVEAEGERITYATLNKQANRLAHLLNIKGSKKEEVIAVLFERELLQIYALLGIFKSGAIYFPLDKKYKENHWTEVYSRMQPKLLLTTQDNFKLINYYNAIFEYTIPEIIVIEATGKGLIDFKCYSYNEREYQEVTRTEVLQDTNPELQSDGEDSNYIFFTSGSSGKPKAVLGRHKSLSHFIHWETKEFGLNENDRIGQLTSFSFDASLRDVFVPLITGGTICIPSNEVKEDVSAFADWLSDQKITLLHTIPTWFRLLTRAGTDSPDFKKYTHLRYLLLAGEKLYNKDIINWRQTYGNSSTIINLYGATESTLIKSFYKIDDELKGAPSDVLGVGKPISNTTFIILNQFDQLCRIEEVGEVFIKTPFLSKGYYKEKHLTNEKFIQNPLNKQTDIIYKTGDYGKYDSSRNVIVSGRKDGMVKINGVRIDINAIEQIILGLNEVWSVKCIFHKKENLDAVLVCFYTAENEIDNLVKNYCLQQLSNYELPSLFIYLEKFPLNVNGKTDLSALKKKIANQLQERGAFKAPSNAVEEKIVEIWKEVLGLEEVSTVDNFFELGGHSLMIAQILNRVQKRLGSSISFSDFFNEPTIEGMSKMLKKAIYTPIPKVAEAASYVVTPAQNRMWILSQLQERSLAYNMSMAVRFNGAIDVELLEVSVIHLIHRHEVLRTCFKLDSTGEIRQFVLPADELTFKLEIEDYTKKRDKTSALKKYFSEKNSKPFNLAKAPLLNAAFLKLGLAESAFFVSMHHIIGDGWSMEVLVSEVVKIYNSLYQGQSINLPALSIQYKDYAAWLNEDLQLEKQRTSEQFWLEQFSGELPVLELPAYKPRPLVQTYNGARISHSFSAEFLNKLKTFSRNQGATLFMTLLAGVNALLHRYTSQEDIIVGTPIAGREHPDLENQVGLYLNTLAIRTKVKREQSFKDLLDFEKNTLLKAYEHQNYPFDELVSKLNLKTDPGRNALFDVVVVLQNQIQLQNINHEEEMSGLTTAGFEVDLLTAKFDIRFAFIETNTLQLNIDFNTDIYDESLINRMFIHLENLLTTVLEQPDKMIGQINYLSNEERNQILVDFNNTAVDYPEDKTIIELFEDQATKTPEHIALVFEERQLTYTELDMEATALANFLLENVEIVAEDLIGIKLQRSEWSIISLLAILKTGAAYVPIDLEYPKQRIDLIEQDSDCKIIIDEDLLSIYEYSESNVAAISRPKITSRNLAYVMYTSGSTGKPKGVMVEHRSISRLVKSSNFYKFSEEDILLSTGSFSFDATIFEYWGSLLNGGQLILCSKETLLDSVKLEREIAKRSVNIMWFTAGWFNQLVDTNIAIFSKLKTVVAGGDRLSPAHVSKLRSKYKHLEIINGYGPTENTTFSLTYNVKEVSGDIPIGYPINNSTAYILDDFCALQPVGIIGEICLGGDGLSRGYLNQKELTKEKFISNPFDPSKFLYKTGDLGRCLPDGKIEFIGRKDDQVKIRGYRIELGEIESQLKSKEDISNAVIIVQEKENGIKDLVALVVSDQDQNASELRAYLTDFLPRHMIPAYFFQVEAFPLTKNGKVDKRLLREAKGVELLNAEEYVEPKTEEEKVLVSIWKEVLELETVGVTNDFFDLGGHSLKAITMLHKINQEFDLNIEFTAVFKLRTITELAAFIANSLWDKQQVDTNLVVDKITI